MLEQKNLIKLDGGSVSKIVKMISGGSRDIEELQFGS
jgi:hypothetical protein